MARKGRKWTEQQEKAADAALVLCAPQVPYSIKIPVVLAMKIKRRTEKLGADFTASWAERLDLLLRSAKAGD